jgi:hypothetical protein
MYHGKCPINVDFFRARITHPSGIVSPGRFTFHNGIAAVWQEDKQAGTASRVLYAPSSTFTRATRGRTHTLSTGSDVWSVIQLPGGG